jgi:hypothetical protein
MTKYIGCGSIFGQASEAEILGLPEVEPKQKLDTVMGFSQLCDEAKWLIGFSVNSGSSIPKKTAGKRNHWHRDRERIASSLHKIRHWNIWHGDYSIAENVQATWFIDPLTGRQASITQSGSPTTRPLVSGVRQGRGR